MRRLFTISRVRFWIYVLGPYLVGAAAAGNGVSGLAPVLLAFYFTLPANLLIYGVNDIYDYETDKLNAKKHQYEALVEQREHRALWRAIAVANIPFLLLAPWLNAPTLLALVVFAVLGVGYSMPPMRTKVRPFFDAATNALYIMPGIAAYFAFGGTALPWALVLAAVLWAMAMHAYSAVPDIAADTKAGMRTVATALGARGTVVACLLAYTASAVLAAEALGVAAYVGLLPYAALMVLSLWRIADVFRWYKAFPYVNTLVGMALFFLIALTR